MTLAAITYLLDGLADVFPTLPYPQTSNRNPFINPTARVIYLSRPKK